MATTLHRLVRTGHTTITKVCYPIPLSRTNLLVIEDSQLRIVIIRTQVSILDTTKYDKVISNIYFKWAFMCILHSRNELQSILIERVQGPKKCALTLPYPNSTYYLSSPSLFACLHEHERHLICAFSFYPWMFKIHIHMHLLLYPKTWDLFNHTMSHRCSLASSISNQRL